MKNLFKKIFVFMAIIGALSLISSILLPKTAFADGFDGRDGAECPNYLGLTSWDCGVNISNEESLKSGIWTIAANVAVDIAVIAAYLVLGYVIYGGYQYIFSSGDPGKVANGKKTLTQAFIGLAVVMLANIIMGTIRIILVGGSFKDCTAASACASADPNALVTSLITWFISISGIVSAIFLVYGGVSYITSSGDPSKLSKAKQVIVYALIGLAIVALASVITAFVANTIRNNTETSLINNSNIIKGVI